MPLRGRLGATKLPVDQYLKSDMCMQIEAAKIDEHLDTCEAQELSAKLNETLAEARKTDLRKRSAIQDLKIARFAAS